MPFLAVSPIHTPSAFALPAAGPCSRSNPNVTIAIDLALASFVLSFFRRCSAQPCLCLLPLPLPPPILPLVGLLFRCFLSHMLFYNWGARSAAHHIQFTDLVLAVNTSFILDIRCFCLVRP